MTVGFFLLSRRTSRSISSEATASPPGESTRKITPAIELSRLLGAAF